MEAVKAGKKSFYETHYVLTDSAPGGHHGKLLWNEAVPGSPWVCGKFGSALWLRGEMVGDEYPIVDDYPESRKWSALRVGLGMPRRSLATRSYCRTLNREHWRSNISPRRKAKRRWRHLPAGLGGDGRRGNYSQTALRLRHGKRRCFENRWQHVAFVADGAILPSVSRRRRS